MGLDLNSPNHDNPKEAYTMLHLILQWPEFVTLWTCFLNVGSHSSGPIVLLVCWKSQYSSRGATKSVLSVFLSRVLFCLVVFFFSLQWHLFLGRLRYGTLGSEHLGKLGWIVDSKLSPRILFALVATLVFEKAYTQSPKETAERTRSFCSN